MSYKDLFDNADVLDSLSWMAFKPTVRIAKLARLYLNKESDISYYHRNYKGPTEPVVRTFVKSCFQPPRGQIRLIVQEVMAEVSRQKEIQQERQGRQPFVWSKLSVQKRRNLLADARYTIYTKNWRGNKERHESRCTAVGCIGDVLLMVDEGTYSAKSRIYMKHRRTNRVKVVVMEESAKSITDALVVLAPKQALRSIFDGSSIKLDFEHEGFELDGKLVKWRNVLKVYNGANRAHNTWANPKKAEK